MASGNPQYPPYLWRASEDDTRLVGANAELIATIEDSLRIADEGKRHRAEAEAELKTLESTLRETLSAARAKPVQAKE